MEDDGELLLFVAVDRRRDGVDHLLVDVRAVGEVENLRHVLVGDVHVLELLVFDGDGHPVHVEVEQGGLLVAGGLLFDVEHTRDADVVAGRDLSTHVVFEVDVDRLGGLPAAQPLG